MAILVGAHVLLVLVHPVLSLIVAPQTQGKGEGGVVQVGARTGFSIVSQWVFCDFVDSCAGGVAV